MARQSQQRPFNPDEPPRPAPPPGNPAPVPNPHPGNPAPFPVDPENFPKE